NRPLYMHFLYWLWGAVRPGVGTWFFWAAGLLFLAAEYRWPARVVHRRAHFRWDMASYVAGGIYIQLTTLFFVALLPHHRPAVLAGAHPVEKLLNHWMHGNVNWGMRWMEWMVVTPRYHRIHHSQLPEHLNTSFGIIFSFWDRLFCTLRDPDAVTTAYP